MMNDTVREELQTKVSTAFESVTAKKTEREKPVITIQAPPLPIPSKPAHIKIETSDLNTKRTSPTLVEFQSKNSTLPDWRLQLRNSIRERHGGQRTIASYEQPAATYQKQLVTNGANALKSEVVEQPEPAIHEDARVANALKRIEDSRKAFLPEAPKAAAAGLISKPAAARSFPFNVVSRTPHSPARPIGLPVSTHGSVKPKLVSPLRIEKKGFDTNKLPPLSKPSKFSAAFVERDDDIAQEADVENEKPSQSEMFGDQDLNRIQIKENLSGELIVGTEGEVEDDEIDDLAPLAMRFNAGLFDLIIGGFASLLVLSPFMLTGGSWITFSGLFAFVAALAIVMFVYLTVSIGVYGRTFGMRIFSLELVDADENAYPTIHQAAVSSSVYLLSLATGGIGFLPLLFNEEKRAAHDIASGTVLIREF